MGKTLAEYAARDGLKERPAEESEAIAAAAAAAEERAAQIEEADRLKESIAQQLETGTEPQFILYAAIGCIGLLTNDADWTAQGQAQLDAVYGDMAQRSFLTDTAAIIDRRLKAEAAAYNDKLRRQLERQQGAYRKIAAHITEALAELDTLEGRDKRLDWTAEIED